MKFSVIIPTCDRPERLRECLRRLMDQASANFEIIVTDDSRADEVPSLPEGVKWVRGPRRGPAANRNLGARHARGEWLAFLDDDCLPAAGWISAYESAAKDGIDLMEGRTVCPLEDRFGFFDIVENLAGGAFWSCNLAVRRDRFEELGGFDEDFTRPVAEDMEFAWRMRRRGLKSVFVREAMVIHPPRRMGMRDLVSRRAAHRWHLLYRLKTGQGPALGSFPPVAVGALVVREYVDHARMIRHLRRRGEETRWKADALQVLWKCVSLPWFLPYYLYWEMRWRWTLRRKAGAGA